MQEENLNWIEDLISEWNPDQLLNLEQKDQYKTCDQFNYAPNQEPEINGDWNSYQVLNLDQKDQYHTEDHSNSVLNQEPELIGIGNSITLFDLEPNELNQIPYPMATDENQKIILPNIDQIMQDFSLFNGINISNESNFCFF